MESGLLGDDQKVRACELLDGRINCIHTGTISLIQQHTMVGYARTTIVAPVTQAL